MFSTAAPNGSFFVQEETCRALLRGREPGNDDPTLFDNLETAAFSRNEDVEQPDDSTATVCPKCGSSNLEWLFDIRPVARWRERLHLANFPAAARRALAKNLATSHPP